MHWIDLSIIATYLVGMLLFGFWFFRKNEAGDDYYVGGRRMGSLHIGLSVVATDVGGGFSIGLGGLGFVMGIAGSWMLFTGLIGAWLTAILLIPKIKNNPAFERFLTFPQVFGHHYGRKVAVVAGLISAIGYTGFTSAQLLAGAKLAAGTFAELPLNHALLIMGGVAVLYTVLGGLKAVIYTDTLQWSVLMIGLVFIGIPISFSAVGGWSGIMDTVRPDMISLTNVTWYELFNWGITIIPVWFVAMTLYQRIYACRDVKTARRAWYLAGLFEYPVMAFLGVALGLMARVAADQGMFHYQDVGSIAETDPETGLPMLLRTVLPVGFMGLMMAAYFSAVLSTADSCLMAASGNVVTDIIGAFTSWRTDDKRFVRLSQLTTLIIGAGALLLAATMTSVLDLMLYSYAFMVSGLLIPVLGLLWWKRSATVGAMGALLGGGITTLFLQLTRWTINREMSRETLVDKASSIQSLVPAASPEQLEGMSRLAMYKHLSDVTDPVRIINLPGLDTRFVIPLPLDANAYGIAVAAILFVSLSYLFPGRPVRD